MRGETYRIIEMAIGADATLSPAERKTILAFCRNPVAAPCPAKKAAPILLTPAEVAVQLHVHIRTVKRHIRSGKLGSLKVAGVRRVTMADYLALMDGADDSRLAFEIVPDKQGGRAVFRVRKVG